MRKQVVNLWGFDIMNAWHHFGDRKQQAIINGVIEKTGVYLNKI